MKSYEVREWEREREIWVQLICSVLQQSIQTHTHAHKHIRTHAQTHTLDYSWPCLHTPPLNACFIFKLLACCSWACTSLHRSTTTQMFRLWKTDRKFKVWFVLTTWKENSNIVLKNVWFGASWQKPFAWIKSLLKPREWWVTVLSLSLGLYFRKKVDKNEEEKNRRLH